MRFLIAKFDNDYHTISKTFYKNFSTREDAKKWCRENSWSGESYVILNFKIVSKENNIE